MGKGSRNVKHPIVWNGFQTAATRSFATTGAKWRSTNKHEKRGNNRA